MSDLSTLLGNLADHYTVRTHVAPLPEVRRKPTDSRPPNGLAEGYGSRANTNASRRHGAKYGTYYRPKPADLAGAALVTPPTMRPRRQATVKPAGHIKINGPAVARTVEGKRRPSKALAEARANGASNGMRTALVAQHNLAVATGGYPLPGIDYSAGPQTRLERAVDHDSREDWQRELRERRAHPDRAYAQWLASMAPTAHVPSDT